MVGNLLALHGVIFLHHLTVVSSRENRIVNLALNKPARQSSTHSTLVSKGSADLAVDGRLDSDYAEGSCTHTEEIIKVISLFTLFESETHPPNREASASVWWEVDLEKRYRIGDIKILNRNHYVNRLHDVRVDVYDNKRKTRGGRHCTTHPGPAGPGWCNLSCDSPVTGRYVRITKPKNDGHDVLTLCEVEIYEALEEILSFHFKRDSKMTAFGQGQGQKVKPMSPGHCGVICVSTQGCQGFKVNIPEMGQSQCQVVMECPDEGRNAGVEDGTIFYHLCW